MSASAATNDDVIGPPGPSTRLNELCPRIYKACLDYPDKSWTVEDIIALDIVPNGNVELISKCMNALFDAHQVSQYNKGGTTAWKAVEPKQQAKYKGLSRDEMIVFSYIEAAKENAIWTLHISRKSNIHRENVQAAVKKLVQKNIVKMVIDSAHPQRKMVMLAEYTPSSTLTGGAFYTNGALDDDVVNLMTEQAFSFIQSKSWDNSAATKKAAKRNGIAPSREEAHRMRSEALRKGPQQLPLPPGYAGYPNLKDVTSRLNDLGLIKNTLKEKDVEQLLDILCWDGRITRVRGGEHFKSVKGASESFEQQPNTNGLTEAPCGRCPVFEWCEDDGPVNARTCTYFADWLAQ